MPKTHKPKVSHASPCDTTAINAHNLKTISSFSPRDIRLRLIRDAPRLPTRSSADVQEQPHHLHIAGANPSSCVESFLVVAMATQTLPQTTVQLLCDHENCAQERYSPKISPLFHFALRKIAVRLGNLQQVPKIPFFIQQGQEQFSVNCLSSTGTRSTGSAGRIFSSFPHNTTKEHVVAAPRQHRHSPTLLDPPVNASRAALRNLLRAGILPKTRCCWTTPVRREGAPGSLKSC